MCTRVNHSVPLLRFTCPFSFRGFVVLSFELGCFILFSEAWEGVSIGSACNRRHGRFPMCMPTPLLLCLTALLLRAIILLHPSCNNPITPSLGPLDWGLLYGLGRPSNPKCLRPLKLLHIRGPSDTITVFPRPYPRRVVSETPFPCLPFSATLD